MPRMTIVEELEGHPALLAMLMALAEPYYPRVEMRWVVDGGTFTERRVMRVVMLRGDGPTGEV